MNDELQTDLIQKTCDLIRFTSVADNPKQIHACMNWIRAYIEHIPGVFVEYTLSENRPSIVATLHPTRTPALILNGHIDVVAATEEQFVPQLKDGRIYGRGSQDMKGSVAVLLRLIHDLAHSSLPHPNIGIQIVSDEEVGGINGTGRLLEEGWECECFVAAEPTNFDICYEQKGSTWMNLRIPGSSAHSSHPWEGRNPIMLLSDGLQALAQQFPVTGPDEWRTTVTPTMLRTSNITCNRIPDEVFLTIDIRHIPEENHHDIMDKVCSCFVGCEILTYGENMPMITKPNAPGIQRLAELVKQVRGHEVAWYRESYGSDARFYSQRGIPSVCFGPIGSGLHSCDEWVDAASLVDLYHIFWQFAHDWNTQNSE